MNVVLRSVVAGYGPYPNASKHILLKFISTHKNVDLIRVPLTPAANSAEPYLTSQLSNQSAACPHVKSGMVKGDFLCKHASLHTNPLTNNASNL